MQSSSGASACAFLRYRLADRGFREELWDHALGHCGDRDHVLEVEGRTGNLLQFASPELRADPDVVRVALATGAADPLKYASEELQGDRELVSYAVSINASSLKFASPELRADRGVVSLAVQNTGYALQNAADCLRDDRSIVLVAVKNYGNALRYASERLRADRGVVLAALTQSRYNDYRALEHASAALRADVGVVGAAMEERHSGHRALGNASPALQQSSVVVGGVLQCSDRALVFKALVHDARALRYASPELQGDRGLVLEAGLEREGGALVAARQRLAFAISVQLKSRMRILHGSGRDDLGRVVGELPAGAQDVCSWAPHPWSRVVLKQQRVRYVCIAIVLLGTVMPPTPEKRLNPRSCPPASRVPAGTLRCIA